MKILASGDIHGDTTLANKLAKKAKDEKVDLVVLTGDLTDSDISNDNIVGPFVKHDKKVILIPGNHDSDSTAYFLSQRYGATNLHGYWFKVGDIGFFGCGGANVGINQLSEDEIYDQLKKGFDKIKDAKTKIMVTHVHPSETIMENFSKFVPGSSGVRKAIDAFKPDFALCSHIHEAEGIEEIIGSTKVINVGREGKLLDFD